MEMITREGLPLESIPGDSCVGCWFFRDRSCGAHGASGEKQKAKTGCTRGDGYIWIAKPFEPDTKMTVDAPAQPAKAELSGGPVDYYTVNVARPTRAERPAYLAECNDLIEALGMTFAEGELFKALWRSCAARELGKHKAGHESDGGVYDGEKMAFYAGRVLAVRKGGAA